MSESVDSTISAIYASDWGRILATIIRLSGDFSIAEEATQEAFEAALQCFREQGIPEHPRAWLFQTARNIAIDRVRRSQVLAGKLDTYAADLEKTVESSDFVHEIPDDRLRLMFTCCHPALALEAQVALTLRTLAGLETQEIARAFLVPVATMAQRLVRAKRKIADAKIPYIVPEAREMPERLHAVLTVLYLVFTEGYSATHGPTLVRTDLCAEAIRLTRTLCALMSAEAEVLGLLALMLLHDARREARLDAAGDLILLDDQDRSRWNHLQIAEALSLVEQALPMNPGSFALQAAIAAVHSRAASREDTDWAEIARLYAQLERLEPSPVVTLNRSVAIAMTEGPQAALSIVDALADSGELADYHLLHAARADFLRRLGNLADAEKSYLRALQVVGNDSERRFLGRRLLEVRAQIAR